VASSRWGVGLSQRGQRMASGEPPILGETQASRSARLRGFRTFDLERTRGHTPAGTPPSVYANPSNCRRETSPLTTDDMSYLVSCLRKYLSTCCWRRSRSSSAWSLSCLPPRGVKRRSAPTLRRSIFTLDSMVNQSSSEQLFSHGQVTETSSTRSSAVVDRGSRSNRGQM
jgi:hypothetical protein